MSVGMDFDKYNNKDRHPIKPIKPNLDLGTKDGLDPDAIRNYATEIDEYNKDIATYNALCKQHRAKTEKLLLQFKIDALEDVGLAGHNKADKAYEIAWEAGHSSGLYEVHLWIERLAELLEDK